MGTKMNVPFIVGDSTTEKEMAIKVINLIHTFPARVKDTFYTLYLSRIKEEGNGFFIVETIKDGKVLRAIRGCGYPLGIALQILTQLKGITTKFKTEEETILFWKWIGFSDEYIKNYIQFFYELWRDW